MEKTFDSVSFVTDLSNELIAGFEKAGKATTPATVGAVREHAVREKLEKILPGNVGIGSGFVFDSFGHTSKQTDIILYEKGICPVFSIEGTPETTYYPCEGVIAMGEIKSTLDTDDIVDSFSKVESVKKSTRYVQDSIRWRKYFTTFITVGAEEERYSQIDKPFDQIYGFILCHSFGLKNDTILEKLKEETRKRDAHLLPNLIVSLNDGMVLWTESKSMPMRVCYDAHIADSLFLTNTATGCFQSLLSQLNQCVTRGRSTATLPFDKYILDGALSTIQGSCVKL